MSHPTSLQGSRQRAQALAGAGDPVQAVLLLEQALDVGRASLGEDDPDVLTTAHQLAVILRRGGDTSGARRVLEESFAAGQWRLGDADPLMLTISYELGLVAEEMENRHEARRAFGRVAAHGPRALGADHWMVTQARAYLGEDPPTVRMELPTPPPAPVRPSPAPQPPPHTPAPVSHPPVAPFPAAERPPVAPDQFHSRAAEQHAPVAPQQRFPSAAEQRSPGVPEQGFHPSAEQHFTSGRQSHSAPEQQFGAGPQGHFEPEQHVGGGPEQHFPAEQHFPPVPQQRQPVSAPPHAGPAPTPPPRSGSFGLRAPALFAAIAAVLGVAIAVVALVIVLADPGDKPTASDVPTLKGPAPTDVRLRDYGASVQLFWSDPANGRASFMITGAQAGSQLRPMGEVGPATTSFDLNGLNDNLDYCFAVVAVYSSSEFSTSPQTCTRRDQASPSTR
ncbi:fibronectin type III domain-containing protein [Symbioplanes lichenis]|uniref:fibronectin type III domain-containing protein n=1 Tax=Symbioplanes lichenis TaxID=1629072 RepID=UPI002739A622|nr:tetratricopeptide repeat protein [Actinoplanes lichenis]